MSQPRWQNIWRYVHCDPVKPARRANECSGIALLWYKSEAARLRHVSDEAARIVMQPDERDTFARPVREFSMLAQEIVTSPETHGGMTCFIFLRRYADRPSTHIRDSLVGLWVEHRVRALLQLAGFRGYVLNVPRLDSASLGFGLLCDGIEEIAFEAQTDLPPIPDGPVVIGETIWTRAVELYCASHA